jgi:hypothetical protein
MLQKYLHLGRIKYVGNLLCNIIRKYTGYSALFKECSYDRLHTDREDAKDIQHCGEETAYKAATLKTKMEMGWEH